MKLPCEMPRQARDYEPSPIEYRGFQFDPVFKNGVLRRYDTKLRNLWVSLDPLKNSLSLRNSIHVFSQGTNYRDFTLSDFRTSISELSDLLGLNLLNAAPSRMEYACNLIRGDSSPFYTMLLSYWRSPYQPMYKGAEYGRKAELAQYAIKAYDKTRQLWLKNKLETPHKIDRFEIEVKKKQYLSGKGIYINTIADLLKLENAQKLTNDLLEKFKGSEKDIEVDWTGLTAGEAKIFAALQNSNYEANLKIRSPRTYDRYRATCKKIRQTQSVQVNNEISRRIEEKLCYLITA